jgi:hypothetical protein
MTKHHQQCRAKDKLKTPTQTNTSKLKKETFDTEKTTEGSYTWFQSAL